MKPELNVPKKHKYPFRGMLFCKNCEKPLTAGAPKSRSGEKYLRYWCSNKECKKTSIRAIEVINYMVDLFENIETITKEHYKEYLAGAEKYIKEQKGYLTKEQGQLLKKQRVAEADFEDIVVSLRTEGENIEPEERKALGSRKEKLKYALKQCEDRLEEVDEQLGNIKPMDFETFLNTLKTLSASFLSADAETKHEIAQNIFLNLTIEEGKIATVSVKEPFKSMVKKDFVLNGGPAWT